MLTDLGPIIYSPAFNTAFPAVNIDLDAFTNLRRHVVQEFHKKLHL